jgi:CRP-like cAMP-binding protein
MGRTCLDCPADRVPVLTDLARRKAGCALRCVAVAAREPLPSRLRGDYAFALVRRGIVVRQRVDGSGRAISIDIAGPGSALPVNLEADDPVVGYAVDDVMLCLCTTHDFGDALGTGASAREVVAAQSAILHRVERIAEARSRTSATSRVAWLLLAIADTLSPPRESQGEREAPENGDAPERGDRSDDVISSAIQQRDLALLVGLRHESVCRSVASLEKKGLIHRSASGVKLLDRAALEAL